MSRDNTLGMHIVLFAGSTNQTKDGSIVRKCRVADKSASICFSLWNEQAGAIEAGDILKLTKGLTIELELCIICNVPTCIYNVPDMHAHVKHMLSAFPNGI